MAARTRLDLEPAKGKGDLSEQQQKVFTILNSIIQPDGGLDPLEAAHQVDDLVPKEGDAEDFLWSFWNLFIGIVKLVPRQHEGQELLVQLLGYLLNVPGRPIVIWGSEISLWKDFPLLGPVMRESWQPPKTDEGAPDTASAEKWVNLNSFAARLGSTANTHWHNFPVWELRAALEEDIQDQDVLAFKLAAAGEWIIHAGQAIYIHITMEPTKEENKVLKPGPLYEGKSKLDLERWEFWKKRLTEISKVASGESATRSAALVEKINDLESKAFKPSDERYAS